jgi:3-oxoacyl-[acyl-carrier protein] reductase
MDLGLDGRVAWVLGGSSGLGKASASALAAEGARVVISSRSEERLTAAAEEITRAGSECHYVPVDVGDGDQIAAGARRIADEVGPVDILVSNAGGPPPGTFEDLSEDDLFAAFSLTTASAWRLAKAVLPSMLDRGSGVMLFLTSASTKEVIPNLLLSNMMRAAVVGMAKMLSKELGPHGIRVLCVAPGRIETQRLVQLDEAASKRTGKTVEEIRGGLQAAIPLRRYGDPSEFGETVAFLASERASYLNGISVVVDGGALNGVLS